MRRLTIFPLMLLLLAAVPVSAEDSFDIYVGRTSTDTTTFTHTDSGGFTVITTDTFAERPAFGFRASNWSERHPHIGLAIDMSYFRPDGDITAVDTLPLSLLFSVRTASTARHEARKMYAYFMIGPGLYLFDVHARLSPFETFKGLGADVGLDTRIGLNWRISRSTAFFIEYRHTRFDVDGTYEDYFGWIQESITMKVESDHINFGLSF